MADYSSFKMKMLAPCGVNCAVCLGHVREKKKCPGCYGEDAFKPYHCTVCKIKLCEHADTTKPHLCIDCATFPCTRMKQLDKRYRSKYNMSPIENLRNIKELGKRKFIEQEKERWTCSSCGHIICVHRQTCDHCGIAWKK
jgi:hypothetical protein